MVTLRKSYKTLSGSYSSACIGLCLWAERHANFLLFVFGVVLVGIGTNNLANAQSNHPLYGDACNRLLALMEGPFGALVTVGAGVGAIIASAVGGFKMAWTLVVVAVGAFILRAYITLFFENCQGAGGGN